MTATTPDALSLRELFMIDPEVAFFNHGSFGACPRPVFEAYQRWQRELEWQPVEFMFYRVPEILSETRAHLARWLNTAGGNLIFTTNATMGMNTVARSLPLAPGDEILTCDHEYGAINNTWRYNCEKTGARMVVHPMELPQGTPEAFAEAFCAAIGPRTKIISLSHITSPSALILPIAAICRRARAAGVLTVIDGAHAPGHVELDMEAIGADFYAGNCHKWLSAPKGSGFLYVRPEHHELVDPLVISHGQYAGPRAIDISEKGQQRSSLSERHDWQGTRDMAAWFAITDAIDFQGEHNWPAVRQRCHATALELAGRIASLGGCLAPLANDPDSWHGQMITIPVQADNMAGRFRQLYEDWKVVVAGSEVRGQACLRLSVQGYNTEEECERLVTALAAVLKS